MPSRISVIIPALNEAESIGFVVGAMPWDDIAECIVVDNGSTDETSLVAQMAGARVIAAPRGYGSAMHAGVQAAMAMSDILVFMDGDGSDVAAEMALLVGPVERGEADFVLGSRLANREPGSMLASQVFASHLISALVKMFYGFKYSDMASFRVIRREALGAMDMREMTYGWNLEMQIKAVRDGLRIVEVPVHYRRRIGGVSKVSGDWKASIKAGFRILSVFWRVRKSGTQRTQRENSKGTE